MQSEFLIVPSFCALTTVIINDKWHLSDSNKRKIQCHSKMMCGQCTPQKKGTSKILCTPMMSFQNIYKMLKERDKN